MIQCAAIITHCQLTRNPTSAQRSKINCSYVSKYVDVHSSLNTLPNTFQHTLEIATHIHIDLFKTSKVFNEVLTEIFLHYYT